MGGCMNMSTVTPDECTLTLDNVACPSGDSAGDLLSINGIVHWSHDGATGDGLIQLSLTSTAGVTVCAGTYDIHYQRQ